MTTSKTKNLWLLSDGKPGHLNQLRAIAEMMQASYQEITMPSLGVLSTFVKHSGLGLQLIPQPELPQQKPDLILSIGSMGILLQAKFLSNSTTHNTANNIDHTKPIFRTHLMGAGKLSHLIDFNIIMHHDVNTGLDSQCYILDLPPSPLALSKAANLAQNSRVQPLVELPNFSVKSYVTILLGGPNRAFKMSDKFMKKFAQQLVKSSSEQSIGYYITPSRRTPKNALKILQNQLKDTPYYLWDGQGENPLFSMVNMAKAVLVTEDSVSMQSDIVHAHKALYIVQLEQKIWAKLLGNARKFRQFSTKLITKGYARPFRGDCSYFTPVACHSTTELVQAIDCRMKNFQLENSQQ